jgi:hypothetical protein
MQLVTISAANITLSAIMCDGISSLSTDLHFDRFQHLGAEYDGPGKCVSWYQFTLL